MDRNELSDIELMQEIRKNKLFLNKARELQRQIQRTTNKSEREELDCKLYKLWQENKYNMWTIIQNIDRKEVQVLTREIDCMINKYPKYTKRFYDMADVYIKNGEAIKNRGGRLDDSINIEERIKLDSSVIIEEDEIVTIYCGQEKLSRFVSELDNLRERFGYEKTQNIKIICNQ